MILRRHLPLYALMFVVLAFGKSVYAQTFDGKYRSNQGNFLTIKGHTYTYLGICGGPGRSEGTVDVSGANQTIQFYGYLGYPCIRQGPRLVCDTGAKEGRRVWLQLSANAKPGICSDSASTGIDLEKVPPKGIEPIICHGCGKQK